MKEMFVTSLEELIEDVEEIARLEEYNPFMLSDLYDKLLELQRSVTAEG